MSNKRRPLTGLLAAQFVGAFNDNAFKMVVTLLAINAAQRGLSGDLALEQANQGATTEAFVIFTLPLMVFSLPAMIVGDRISKRTIILAMKLAEVALMGCGTFALAADPEGLLPLIVLGLMGVQSAFFAPAKYGILPEILPHTQLSSGNGQLEMWSFLAIILGTIAGGFLLDGFGEPWVAGAILTGLAAVGLAAALGVPRVAAAGCNETPLQVTAGAWRAARETRALWLAILGSAYYWGIASLLGQDVFVYSKSVVGLTDAWVSVPLALLAIGVGIGAVVAGRLSGGKVEVGLIPLGGVGISFFTLLFWLIGPGMIGMFALMLGIGIASGFVIVPLNATIQWRSPADRRGAIIGLTNIFAFAGILLGSLSCNWMAQASWDSRTILLGASLVTLGATAWAVWLMPLSFVRMVVLLLARTFYRVRTVGSKHVPESGGALLVPNHVSFVDGLFLIASTDRPVRFIVEEAYYEHPLLHWFLKSMEAIPITGEAGPRKVLRALRDAGQYLDEGHLVCIFAEGEISRTGMLLPFRRGLQRIAKGRNAPILPVHLDRAWGSVLAPLRGKLFRLPTRIPVPITVSFGKPLAETASTAEIRQQIQELAEAATALRAEDYKPLHHSFVSLARRRPWGLLFTDATGRRLSYWKGLVGGVAMARALRGPWKDQENVGLLLPPSIGGGLANFAASLSGRASVNLNYTAGAAGMSSAAKQAGLRTVVTSREFLEKANLELPEGVEPIWAEDLRDSIGPLQRLVAMVALLPIPKSWVERLSGARRAVRREDVTTIIFSSGSTGDPKGVVLTHRNCDSNSEGVAQVLPVSSSDAILGILPLFHSFGYMALWFAANHGIATVFHPNPLDAATIGQLVRRHAITIMVATPTFLQLYMRRCTPGQLGSLRLVVVGAEKLTQRLANAFEERFGVKPLQGYGTTECAPVVAATTLDYRAPGFYQPGSKPGSVGQPLSGVALRVVDPETGEVLSPGQPGMLLVKGPNVMRGYLGRDDLTAEVLKDGWYTTGDIAFVDDDGFLFITDRLSRFSKIGGEMVPHGKIEQALHEAAGFDVQTFAVTAVPDERKGERLVVLHTTQEKRIPGVLEKLEGMGLPPLFVPKTNQFFVVEELPLLGTGKLDLRAIKKVAGDLAGT